MNGSETRVYADEGELARAASGYILGLIRRALEEAPSAREEAPSALVVLSGGGTPRATYELLAAQVREDPLPLDRVFWGFGDERWVPAGHPDSNEGMARRALLEPIGAPEQTILSWAAGSGMPVERAAAYGEKLAAMRPAVVLMGLGIDGHTASLFPGAVAFTPGSGKNPVSLDLRVNAAAVWLEKEKRWRLTLCPFYLNRCRTAVFLAAGAAKRGVVARAVAGDPAIPASWVRGQETVFMVTRDAAGNE